MRNLRHSQACGRHGERSNPFMQHDRQREGQASGGSLTTRWTRIGALDGEDKEQAWQWFVERYRPFVRGILDGMLGSARRAAAEEEFWGYIWLSGALQRADRDRRFRAFLSGIVRNFARTFARQRGLQLADAASIAALPTAGSDAVEMRLWVDNVIANATKTLTHENAATATAVACFYGLDGGLQPGKEMTASEIAAAVNNTTRAICMQLFRGRKRMRQLIEEELREGCSDDEAWREELQALLGATASRLPGLLGEV
jgi:DNA-directed RNA polymerase specialized sigma24 family protein